MMHRAAVNLTIRRRYHASYNNDYRHPNTVFALRLIGVFCLVAFCTSLSAYHVAGPRGDPLVSLNARETSTCRDVHTRPAKQQCAFIKQHCHDEDDGLISYLQLYYCTLGASKVATWLILVPWIAILFTTIGICAGDFFAVNLSSIARSLRVSDTMAGVTLLALGNGGPDIFSTWAAVTSNTPELAVGELVGAASFTTTVVAGSLALVTSFRVQEVSMMRDAFFLLVTACLLLACLITQGLHLWQGLLMIGIYVLYVAVVMIYHWRTPQESEEDGEGDGDDEDQQVTPTESQPLLCDTHAAQPQPLLCDPQAAQPQHPQHPHPCTHTRRAAGRMSPAVYREIGEWRLAHGRCIMPPSGYSVQPSLLGSCEQLWRKRLQSSQDASPEAQKFTLATPRSHEGDDRVFKTLFPSLHDLSYRSTWHMVINVVSAVPFLIFKLTIPVVDNEHNHDCHHGWDRWLLLLQGFVAPQFVWLMFWLSSEIPPTLLSWIVPAAYCLLGSVIFASLVLALSSSRHQPPWYSFLSLVGFIISAFWLSTIADEVVAIMKALGAISGLSQAILGYTLLAIGNSLDDWVANITVARHGHPVMALAACFGGPVLNILLGLGTSVTYVTIKEKKLTGKLVPILFKADYVLIVPTAVVAATMIFVVLVLRWSQWQVTKGLGVALIVVWCLLAAGCVVLEVVL